MSGDALHDGRSADRPLRLEPTDAPPPPPPAPQPLVPPLPAGEGASEPIGSTLPLESIQSSEPLEPLEPFEPLEPLESLEPLEPLEPFEDTVVLPPFVAGGERCPVCAYDIRHVAWHGHDQCPECGSTILLQTYGSLSAPGRPWAAQALLLVCALVVGQACFQLFYDAVNLVAYDITPIIFTVLFLDLDGWTAYGPGFLAVTMLLALLIPPSGHAIDRGLRAHPWIGVGLILFQGLVTLACWTYFAYWW